MNAGLIGGIVGGVIGLMGGIIGTYFSIKNTSGPRERAFVIKACVVCWTSGALFLVLMLALPSPWGHLLWVPYAIFLPLGITHGNRTQQWIRRQESTSGDAPGDEQVARDSR